MITLEKGNLFDCRAEAIVNTVNCVGVMGRGIALQFKNRYPENFKFYAKACRAGEVRPGKPLLFETGELSNPRYIVNFPTKNHWRTPSRMEYIRDGMKELVRLVKERNIRSVAVPPLGCGLGGLEWEQVRKEIEGAMASLPDVECHLFSPEVTSILHEVVEERPPEMTEGRAALISVVVNYLRAGLDAFVTLLEIQKLMYFLQCAGQPLRLRFSKGTYGPYADNLRFVLQKMNGHYLTGYSDGGDAPQKPLFLVDGAEKKAVETLKGNAETNGRIARVLELIEGFESPFGMELLSTVHWLCANEGCRDTYSIDDGLRRWGVQKARFAGEYAEKALSRLRQKEWLV